MFQSQTRGGVDLRRGLRCGVAESQFSVVAIAERPNHHPISRDDQSVIQTTRHLTEDTHMSTC